MKIESSIPQFSQTESLKVDIILPRFNDSLGEELYKNTVETLLAENVAQENITLTRIPGCMEIPFAAKKLIDEQKSDVIIALGIVIRGETPHFDYVCRAAVDGITHLNITHSTPIICGVLTVDTLEHAQARVDATQLNKGKEFAHAALEMALLNKA